MHQDTVREGQVTAAVVAQIYWIVWARVDPILHQSASLNVPPQAHEGMTLRNIGPKAFREVFQPSIGPGGYLSPTTTFMYMSPILLSLQKILCCSSVVLGVSFLQC
jgi:hypothetical protein